MVAVFSGFMFGGDPLARMMGLGLRRRSRSTRHRPSAIDPTGEHLGHRREMVTVCAPPGITVLPLVSMNWVAERCER
jgi:hypothetical protein